MTIRQSSHKDLTSLQNIKSAYELETGGQISNKSIDNYIVWLAEENSQIQSAIFIDVMEDFAEIPIVYTIPQFRNQGIGTKLFSEVITWAKSQSLKELVLWPSKPSLPFYARLGFKSNTPDSPLQLSL